MPDGTMYECSDILGQPVTTENADGSNKVRAWDKAVNIANAYRGGGFEDWRLPTKDQLQAIYDKLRVPEHISDNAVVWSSTQTGDNAAWGMDFQDNPLYARMYERKKDDENFVRAVRPLSADDTLTPPPVAPTDPNHEYKAGDIGPTKGVVFFTPNGARYECSPILGGAAWADAGSLAKAHSGGGFTDWSLPTKYELEAIYNQLRKPEFIFDTSLWSSASTNTSSAFGMNYPLITPSQSKKEVFLVRAVRRF